MTGVTLDKTTTSVAVGADVQLAATVAPDDATNKTLTWTSSDATIASVDANGKVTGVAAGAVKITVTTADGAKVATADITVTAPQAG